MFSEWLNLCLANCKFNFHTSISYYRESNTIEINSRHSPTHIYSLHSKYFDLPKQHFIQITSLNSLCIMYKVRPILPRRWNLPFDQKLANKILLRHIVKHTKVTFIYNQYSLLVISYLNLSQITNQLLEYNSTGTLI